MAGSSGWLSRLLSGLQAWIPPSPGTHEARLEEYRVGALLDQELRKPPEQQDEERLHTLRVKYRKMQLINVQGCVWGGGRGGGGGSRPRPGGGRRELPLSGRSCHQEQQDVRASWAAWACTV